MELPVLVNNGPRDAKESDEPAVSARVASVARKRPLSPSESASPARKAPKKQQKRAETASPKENSSPGLVGTRPVATPAQAAEESTDWTLGDASMIPQDLRQKEKEEVLRLLQHEEIEVPAEAFELEPAVNSSSDFSYWRAVDRFYELDEDE